VDGDDGEHWRGLDGGNCDVDVICVFGWCVKPTIVVVLLQWSGLHH
jgi:hypothetical protein